MEIQEAIGRIKEHTEIHYAKEPRAIKISEALYMAVSALEKQIPMKVEYYDDGDYARCPNCDYKDFENGINDWECNFCSRCGQALDWSDNE